MATTLVDAGSYTPRLIVVDQANGSTLTRAAIRAFTRQDFEDQAAKEVGFDKIITQTKEARMCGVRERGMVDLLLSRHVSKPGILTPSVIAPFRLQPQRRTVNANWFRVTAGEAGASGDSRDWKVTVESVARFTGSNALKNPEKFFLVDGKVVIEWKDASSVMRTPIFTITVSEAGADTTKANVTLRANYSTAAAFTAAAAATKASYQPTAGVLSMLANSISNYERHDAQRPAVNNLQLKELWRQTHRWKFQYNQEYVDALEAEHTSQFYKKFQVLPIAEQRRQIEAWVEQETLNTFWYGGPENELQTVEGYTSLPTVTDPDDPTFPIEFKASTLGVRHQLGTNARIYDRQGERLDIDAIMEMCYNLKRNREVSGGSAEVIDSHTGRFNKGRIRRIMSKYYKEDQGATLEIHAQLNQKITFNGTGLFEYDLYDLPDQGCQWAVFHDSYFDDKAQHFAAAQASAGNAIWFPDWSDLAINLLGSKSVKRMTDVNNPLYFNVIQPNMKHAMLNSKTFEVEVGDPNRHGLIENFSDAQPKVTVNGAELA